MTRIACICIAFILAAGSARAEVMIASFYRAPRPDIAAHKYLPFGTILRLVNPKNGREAIVRIHDRGPFIRGRQLDVSTSTAARLGFVRAGVVALEVQVLYRPGH